MRKFFLASVILAITAFPCIACDCVPPNGNLLMQMREATIGFDTIVSASVHRISEVERIENGYSRYFQRVEFRVENVWKSRYRLSETLVTESEYGVCGLKLEAKGRYLVFANRTHGYHELSICSPTAPMSQSREKVAALEKLLKTER